jgi:hypothetical protein
MKRRAGLKVTAAVALTLAVGGTLAACAVSPDDRFAGVIAPSFLDFFNLRAPQTQDGDAAKEPGESTKTVAQLPAEVTLGISSLKAESAGELRGRPAKSLVSVIGRPDFVRRDGSAQIWQYRNARCILDLFVYGGETAEQVKHAELRGSAVGKAPARGCFAKMMQGRIAHQTALAPVTKPSL